MDTKNQDRRSIDWNVCIMSTWKHFEILFFKSGGKLLKKKYEWKTKKKKKEKIDIKK